MVGHEKRTKSADDPDADLSPCLSKECRDRLESEVRLETSLWRGLIFPGYATVRDELERLQTQNRESKENEEGEESEELDGKAVDPLDEPGADSIVLGSRRALDEALLAMRRDAKRGVFKLFFGWYSFKLFYGGSRIELALTALHRARAALYLLYPCRELGAQTDRLQELVGDLPELNPLRASLAIALGHLRKCETKAPELRAALRQIYEQAIGVSQSLQREARALRNAMVIASFALALVLLTVGVGHAIDTRFVSLCTQTQHSTTQSSSDESPVAQASANVTSSGRSSTKDDDTSALGDSSSNSQGAKAAAMASASLAGSATSGKKTHTSDTKSDQCPLGKKPTSFDVFALELAGVLGGLLSVVIPLARGERVKTPYGIFNALLVLKTLAGAASAPAGVMLVQSGLVSNISIESSAAILAYGIVFGFAQQIVTGFVDRRADTLAKETIAVSGV